MKEDDGDDLHGVALVLHQVDVSGLQLGDPPLQLLYPGIFQGRGHHHQEGPLLPEGVRHGDGLHRLPKTHLDRPNQHTAEGEKNKSIGHRLYGKLHMTAELM